MDTRRQFEHNVVFSQIDLLPTFKAEFPETKFNQYRDLTDDQRVEMLAKTATYKTVLEDKIQDTFMTIVPNDREEYNRKAPLQMERIYLYVGDEMGYLKLFNLTNLVHSIGDLKKVPNQIKNRTFNPRRQEVVDTTHMARQLRRALKMEKRRLPPPLDPEMSQVLVRELLCHTDVITSISRIVYEDVEAIATTSQDNTTRVWSRGFDLLGNINMLTDRQDPRWSFKTRQMDRVKMEELSKIESLIDNLNMELEEERKTLQIDLNPKKKDIAKKTRTRANFLQRKEDEAQRDREVEQKIKARERAR